MHLRRGGENGGKKRKIMEKKERPIKPLFCNRCRPHRCGAIANSIFHGILTTHIAYSRVYVQLKCTLQITLLSYRRNKEKIVLCYSIFFFWLKARDGNLL